MTALLYYLTYFGVLVACGLGLPIPEEVTLIGAGYASYLGKTDVLLSIAVCSAGILAGDTCLFVLGRLFGLPLTRRWPFRRHLTPERIERLRAAYARYGARLIFLVRVVPVVRAVAHFTAGTLRFRYGTFAAMDGLGIVLTVPVSVWLAYTFGSQIDDVTRWIQRGNLTVTAVAALALLVLWLWHRRGVRAAAPVPAPAPAPGAPGVASPSASRPGA
ncbi:MAG: DedA family protein [Planctomycetales bacterium]|nr:DedA family protein [Planctomycetales bacterium]